VLLPPIGLAATIEYYRHGNVDLRAALILAVGMFVGAWVGAWLANQMKGPQLRLLFGVFVCALGVYLIFGASGVSAGSERNRQRPRLTRSCSQGMVCLDKGAAAGAAGSRMVGPPFQLVMSRQEWHVDGRGTALTRV
jgi:uncharacterized membrane protein YfcA